MIIFLQIDQQVIIISLNNSTMPLKPLIKVSHIKSSSFLQVPSSYSLPQTFKIKKYLPKFLSFQGVIADGDYSKAEIEKEKIKLFESMDDLKIYKDKELKCRLWENLVVCVNIPVNNRLKAEDQKEALQSKLEQYFDDSFCMSQKNGQIITKQSKKSFSIEEIDIFFTPKQMNPESFDNQFKQFRLIISLAVILPSKQSYSFQEVAECIKADFLSSLKIMTKNKLPIRILVQDQTQPCLFLQSFISNKDEQQKQTLKLKDFFKKEIQMNEEHPKKSQGSILIKQSEEQPVVPRQELSNRQLMLVLLGLFFIYLFLKINPLEKILSESL